MKTSSYDIIVVGAGPAGGQTARELAASGWSVLLIERMANFTQNNFSSGGTPMETLTDFDLPKSVVGDYWHTISVQYDDEYVEWKSPVPRGAVFNFHRLKQFLADDAKKNGASVLMHTKFSRIVAKNADGYVVEIVDQKKQQTQQVTAKVIVDATGPSRAVLSQLSQDQTPPFIIAPGMEYMVKVNKKFKNKKLEKNLVFFMGKKYAPNGYSWIFPMGHGEYKVGIGVDTQKYQRDVGRPMTEFIDLILRDFFGDGTYEITEKHGGTVKCAMGSTKTFVNEQVVGVGDTIFTIYPFVGEGIRHALHSGRLAARAIDQYLRKEQSSLVSYERSMKNYFAIKWRLGSWLITFFEKQGRNNNHNLGKVFVKFQALTFEDVFDLLFKYKLTKYAKVLWNFYFS